MCKISEDIKLCSCGSKEEVYKAANRWEILRRKASHYRIGQVIINDNRSILGKKEMQNLLDKLNSGGLFDFDYNPQPDDKLKIKLSDNGQSSEYDFLFSGGKWLFYNEPFDLFGDMTKPPYTSELRGIVEKPFK